MIWKRWFRQDSQDPSQTEQQTADDGVLSMAESIEAAAIQVGGQGSGENSGMSRPDFLDQLWSADEDRSRNSTLPRFIANATDDVEVGDDADLARRKLSLRDALGASQPVVHREAFAGRHDAMGMLITAIEQNRVHVVIYGERGIGKTSLSHVFAETAREARYLVLYGSCGADANFSAMFKAFCARIPRLYHSTVLPNTLEAEKGDHFDTMLPDQFGPRELADVLAGVTGTRVLIILDEYDRVLDAGFRRDVAELIKNLSDRAAKVQLILTGVAQNLDELIGYAPSIRRNIVGLPMRPLTAAEVKDVLTIGEEAAGIRYTEEARNMVTTIAGGSPYLVRLVAHAAGMTALESRRDVVTAEHGRVAVERVLTEWNASLPRRVQTNLARDQARANWPLLIAAARAGSSADGYFTAEDVVTEMGSGASSGLGNIAYVERELKQFSGPHDLLERMETGGVSRFRYAYPGVSSLLLISAALARLTG